MVEMNQAVREQLMEFGYRNGLNNDRVDEMVGMFDVFGASSDIGPEDVSQMLGVDKETYLAFLKMMGVSLSQGYAEEEDPNMTIENLIQATFSVGVNFGMAMEGRTKRG